MLLYYLYHLVFFGNIVQNKLPLNYIKTYYLLEIGRFDAIQEFKL